MAGSETPSTSGTIKPAAEGSTLAPFRYATFTVLWIATVVANVGVWMQNAAAGWLMTGLTPGPIPCFSRAGRDVGADIRPRAAGWSASLRATRGELLLVCGITAPSRS
jgi:hypothetical protein